MLELTRGRGSDEKEYAVIALAWSLEKVENYWERISKFPIFSDDVEKSQQGFLNFVLNSGAIWYEIVDGESNSVIGLMYLTDIKVAHTQRMTEATWHSMVWDATVGPRKPIAKAAIAAMFRIYGFHRLRAEIPTHFGGVIRMAKKLGFKEEGRLREAKEYKGIWFDSVILSILASEVET